MGWGEKADCSMASLWKHEGNVADAGESKKRMLCAVAAERYLLINEPVVTQTKAKVQFTADERQQASYCS